MGNVELFELFETEPKTQCKKCLLYWKWGFIYCTCGHLLNDSEANRGAIKCTLDLLSIPNYVIKKGRHHGHGFGKTTEQREYHVAHNLRKSCIKRNFQGIHHRFVNDPEFRASQLEDDRDEEVCIKMDELAQKDFSHHMTQAETFDAEGIGGFLSIMTEHLDDWKIVLTSTRRCPHYTIYTKNLENDNSGQCHSGSIILAAIIEFFLQLVAMERFLVELIIIQNESLHMSDVQSDMIERWSLLFAVFGSNLRRATFTICCYFVAIGSFAADGGLL